MAISTSIPDNVISAVVGYSLERGFEGLTAGNLPQRIGVLAEVPAAITDLEPFEFISADEVGQKYGYGTPPHIIARILRRSSGDQLGSIPTVVYPVEEAAGAAATTFAVTVTGTALANDTHTITIAGRTQVDGLSYSLAIQKDDTPTIIAARIADIVASVINSPVTAAAALEVATLTSKWNGISSDQLSVTIAPGDNPSGVTYDVVKTSGSGVPGVGTALGNLGGDWTTIIVNGVGSDSDTLDALEDVNGNPNDLTGRYEPTIFKPFVALVGNTEIDRNNLLAITTGRESELTNVLCVAPGSEGLEMEAAANMAVLYGSIAQSTPERDPIHTNYPDMPVPANGDIGDFATPTGRDAIIKIGSSTVDLVSGNFRVVDFVTTYHPANEPPTAVTYRYVRDIVGVDWNIAYAYRILVELYVFGKTLINDGQATSSRNVISPQQWKGEVVALADDITLRALTADPDFMKESIQVEISTNNPNRFETFFKYKRTGTARVVPTTAETNPNLGTLTA